MLERVAFLNGIGYEVQKVKKNFLLFSEYFRTPRPILLLFGIPIFTLIFKHLLTSCYISFLTKPRRLPGGRANFSPFPLTLFETLIEYILFFLSFLIPFKYLKMFINLFIFRLCTFSKLSNCSANNLSLLRRLELQHI